MSTHTMTPTEIEVLQAATDFVQRALYEVHPETVDHTTIRCPIVRRLADAVLANSVPRAPA